MKEIKTKQDLWELFDDGREEMRLIMGNSSDYALDRVDGTYCIVEYSDSAPDRIVSEGKSFIGAFKNWEDFHERLAVYEPYVKVNRAKLTVRQVDRAKRLLEGGEKACHVATRFGVSNSIVSQIRNGQYKGRAKEEKRYKPPTLNKSDRHAIRVMARRGMKYKDLAHYFDVSLSMIKAVAAGREYK